MSAHTQAKATAPGMNSTASPVASHFPIGCRVLHKIDGCEGNVTAHVEGAYEVRPWDHGTYAVLNHHRASFARRDTWLTWETATERAATHNAGCVVVRWQDDDTEDGDRYRAEFCSYRPDELLRV